MLLIAAAALFGAIAEDVVTGSRITVLDVEVSRWLHTHAVPGMTRFMFVVTDLHSTFAVAGYTTVIAIGFALRRRWRHLLTLLVCVGGGLALNVALKYAVHRARPVFDDPLLTLSTYSFPSGHVAGTTVLYGFLVAWVYGRTRRRGWRLLALLAFGVVVPLVALSRLYLGVHYLSDVIAAFAEGVAWLALCLTLPAAFRREPCAEASAGGRRHPNG